MTKPTIKHNLYCRPINLPVSLGCSIPELIKKNNIQLNNGIYHDGTSSHARIWREYLPKEFVDFFHQLNVQIRYAELFIIHPGGELPIHSDARQKGSNLTKLNIVEGDDTAQMVWYSMINPEVNLPLVDFSIEVSKYLELNKDNAKEEFMTPITQPSLVNVGAFHNVRNITSNNRHRYCVSMLLSHLNQNGDDNTLLQFSDAVEIFKDYLA